MVLQLLSLLDNPDVPLKRVVDLLQVDLELSGELVRVANSAWYGFVQRIDSVKHAVVVLGVENVKRLALTVALNQVAGKFRGYDNLRSCWDHVMASAIIAEELAVDLGLSKDRAYTAGLLHDIGRLALLVSYPVEYANLIEAAREQHFDPLERERQLFDIDHCEAGRWLAEHWNLPADFAQAIAEHHQPAAVEKSLTPLVRCACRLADCLGFSAWRVEAKEPVAEVLAGLPLRNRAQTEEDLGPLGEKIREALQILRTAPQMGK